MGTVPTPYSPVAGDDATQARVLTWADAANYLLGNTTSAGSKRALCVLRQTVTQSIPTAADTAIAFDTEDVDNDNGHSTVTNTSRYTAATSGWYLVSGAVTHPTSATGTRIAYFRKNGTTLLFGGYDERSANASAFTTPKPAPTLVFLNAGDYLELVTQQGSGGALSTPVSPAQVQATMSIEWRSN